MYVIFNSINNKSLHLELLSSNHLSKPAKRLEFIDVPGRNGALVMDDGTKENLEINLVFKLDTRKSNDFNVTCDAIGEWLQGHTGYKDLVFSDGSRFKAICINQIDIPQLARNFSRLEINFSTYKEVAK